MLLLRDLRAELLRACGPLGLSPARGTTVRLLSRSYRAARPRYAHRAPPRPPRGDRARVRAARGHRMSVAYRHHMTRAADCGASHVRGERTLRVRSMYVPVLCSCAALPMRCARTSVHALLLRCSCMHCLRPAHALLMRCTHVLISRALPVHRACGPLLHSSCTARAIQAHCLFGQHVLIHMHMHMHMHMHVHCPCAARAYHTHCTCAARALRM